LLPASYRLDERRVQAGLTRRVASCLQVQSLAEESMLKTLAIAAALAIAIVPAASAFAEDAPKVKKTVKVRDKGKDVETTDRLGNFEIQDLMSTYNQPEPPPK
jgi:hypothetical protein